jgi:uncharacterized cupredoxin-like copper-binding protein
MKTGFHMLAALVLIPIAAYAGDGVREGVLPGMMHGPTDSGQVADAGHVHGTGKQGDPTKISRTVQVLMSDDMKFTPAKIDAKRGETIRFVVRNGGKLKHEMVLGSKAELKQHAKLMRSMPGMEHAEPNMVTLAPGATGELIWRFTKAGSFDFGCLQPGHFEAGMLGKVLVK